MGEYRPFAISKFENNVDFIPEMVEGEFDIPFIKPEEYVHAEYVPFHEAGSIWYKREEKGIHFFIDDYKFSGIWNQRERYRKLLTEYKVVLSPDFSPYYDWPIMVQRWNHYRKHLIGAWMQSIGCIVYPTVTWSDEKSYAYCFDGEPYGATVCVSNMGMRRDKENRRLFMNGYDKMMEVLEPETILFYGTIPKECKGNIVPMELFEKHIKETRK